MTVDLDHSIVAALDRLVAEVASQRVELQRIAAAIDGQCSAGDCEMSTALVHMRTPPGVRVCAKCCRQSNVHAAA